MKITTKELRKAFDLICTHMEETNRSTIDLVDDYYWHIPPKSLFAIENEPQGLTIGRLSDDWDEIGKFIDGKKERLSFALVWISAILRAIGEKNIW